MTYLPHGWIAGAIAMPFVILAATLEKRHGFLGCLSECCAWLLMNLW